jgi:hypothetical protein
LIRLESSQPCRRAQRQAPPTKETPTSIRRCKAIGDALARLETPLEDYLPHEEKEEKSDGDVAHVLPKGGRKA